MCKQKIFPAAGRSDTAGIGLAIVAVWIFMAAIPALLPAQTRARLCCRSGCNAKGQHCVTKQKGYETKDALPIPESDELETPPVPDELPADDLMDAVPDDGLAESLLAATAGATAGAFGIPNMIGDSFGAHASSSVISRVFAVNARGDILSGSSGDPNALLAFEVGTDTVANDIFSIGTGIDTDGVPGADTFQIVEPVPPTDAPTSPGAGFVFAGGLANNPTGSFQNGELWSLIYSYDAKVVIPAGGGGGGGGDMVVGRMKLAENASPIPRNRIFFNYSLFDNVPLTANGVTVNRFSPGFETTFLNETMSFELRAPFAATLDTDFSVDGQNDLQKMVFGDLFLTYKSLLLVRDRWLVSAGLSMTVPTADDSQVSLSDGTPLVRFDNEAVHLMPFLGWVTSDGDRWFTQGFLQLDMDVNGDSVSVNAFGNGLVPSGKMQETSLLYLDLAAGYWLYRADPERICLLRGVAPTVELHYNSSLQDADVVRRGNFQVGETLRGLQMLNCVLGGTFEIGQSTLALGYTMPIGNGSDQQFDGELRAFWNRFY